MSASSTYGAKEVIQQRITLTLASLYGDAMAGADPMVSATSKPGFGDYQCNAALSMAKKLKVRSFPRVECAREKRGYTHMECARECYRLSRSAAYMTYPLTFTLTLILTPSLCATLIPRRPSQEM
jgi:hypothetical protein